MDPYEEMGEFYDLIYSDTYDLEFYLNEAKKVTGPILEVACGTGRIYLKILKEKIDITGVDLSQKMLNLLVKKANSMNLKPKIVKGDMRDFDLGKKFKLIFLPYRSFLHMLNDQDRIKALNNFKKHLDKDGKLILHTYNPSKFELELTKGFHHLESEKLKAADGTPYGLDWYLDYDDKKKIAHFKIELNEENGLVHTYTMDISYLSPQKLRKQLIECGFSQIKEYCGFEYGVVDNSCKELIWIVKK